MTRRPHPHLIASIAALALSLVSTAALAAAELKDPAVQAFLAHLARTERAFLERVRQPVADPAGWEAMRAGRVMAGPGSGDGILTVNEGLVHHWRARALIPGVAVNDTLAISRAYEQYPQIFKPVRAARVLDTTGDRFRVQFRMQQSAGGIGATLELRSAISYTRVDERHAYVMSRSEDIREVKNPGRRTEALLAPGRDSGYLWRAATFSRWQQDGDGVWMEMETLGLSRSFPPMLGVVIEPIARHVGRRSAEASVEEFRAAVASRTGR